VDPSSGWEPSVFLGRLKEFNQNDMYRRKLEKAEELLCETDRRRIARELGNSVTAPNSVPTAIYSFLRNQQSFEETVLFAVSLGGDTDTIGAMAGAISGAYHGVEVIPDRWRSKLERRDYIEALAEKLWKIKMRNTAVEN
jgi:poly(ADP-ribose) glycohydrolase ARH3